MENSQSLKGPSVVTAQRQVGDRRNLALDVLRFLAIFLVLGFHSPVPDPAGAVSKFLLWPWRGLGWVGVDLFFVLSGFLVGGLLLTEFQKRGQVNLGRFYTRRAFKIWPQYYVFMLFWIARSIHAGFSLRAYVGNLLNIQNYTGPQPNYTWSLAVEEHFYLLLALFIYFSAKRKFLSFKSISALVVVVAVVSIASRLVMMSMHYDRTQVRIWTNSSLDTLGVGVFLAALYHFEPEKFTKLGSKRAALWGTIAVCFVTQYLWHTNDWFNLSVGLDFVALAGASVLLLSIKPKDALATTKPPSRLVRSLAWVGQRSYGIYLWHWPAGSAAAIIVYARLHGHLPGAIVWSIATLVWVAFPIAAGAFMTWAVEMPSLRLRERVAPANINALSLPSQDSAKPDPAATERLPEPEAKTPELQEAKEI